MIDNERMTEKMKIGMPGELHGMKKIADLFGWDESKIWWYHHSEDDIMLLSTELRATIKAQIKVNRPKTVSYELRRDLDLDAV